MVRIPASAPLAALAAGLLALAAPIAAQEPAPAAAREAPAARRRPDPNLITRDEIERARVRTGRELVQRLRPRWLRTRGSGQVASGLDVAETPGGPATVMPRPDPDVFLDDTHVGKTEVLQTLATTGVVQVRYYSAAQATTRFGTGYAYGVIQFRTR